MPLQKVLITGAAGFIGFHLTQKAIKLGYSVTGIDNLNDYYDVTLKASRLKILRTLANFSFQEMDLSDRNAINQLFAKNEFTCVINLAAQAGVRYSLINPHAYLESNIHGFLNILEGCRHSKVGHLIYASSSSVYGANKKMPFSVHDNVDHPISLYAASKKSNELMAHTYSALYNLPTTGLRFFTVYGPFGRPDMALFIFTKAILEGKPIAVYNHGRMKRDFTYDASFTYGRSEATIRNTNIRDVEYALALDAVTNAAGQIVCRVQTPGASTAIGFSANTCLPASIAARRWRGRKPGVVVRMTTSTPESMTRL